MWLWASTGTVLQRRGKGCQEILKDHLGNCFIFVVTRVLAAILGKNKTTGEIGIWPTVLAKAWWLPGEVWVLFSADSTSDTQLAFSLPKSCALCKGDAYLVPSARQQESAETLHTINIVFKICQHYQIIKETSFPQYWFMEAWIPLWMANFQLGETKGWCSLL